MKNKRRVLESGCNQTQLTITKIWRIFSVPDSNPWLPWLVGTKNLSFSQALLLKTRQKDSSNIRNAPICTSRLHLQPIQEGTISNKTHQKERNNFLKVVPPFVPKKILMRKIESWKT